MTAKSKVQKDSSVPAQSSDQEATWVVPGQPVQRCETHSGGASKASLGDYRQWLISAEHKAQDDFDKAVLSLSGGALGISFVFVKEIVGPGEIQLALLLMVAWIAWALSSLSILASYFFSHLSLRRAIKQCDDGTIYGTTPGGIFATLTGSLNACGALLFVAGVISMSAFVYLNINARGVHRGTQGSTTEAAGPIRAAAGQQSSSPSKPSAW